MRWGGGDIFKGVVDGIAWGVGSRIFGFGEFEEGYF